MIDPSARNSALFNRVYAFYQNSSAQLSANEVSKTELVAASRDSTSSKLHVGNAFVSQHIEPKVAAKVKASISYMDAEDSSVYHRHYGNSAEVDEKTGKISFSFSTNRYQGFGFQEVDFTGKYTRYFGIKGEINADGSMSLSVKFGETFVTEFGDDVNANMRYSTTKFDVTAGGDITVQAEQRHLVTSKNTYTMSYSENWLSTENEIDLSRASGLDQFLAGRNIDNPFVAASGNTSLPVGEVSHEDELLFPSLQASIKVESFDEAYQSAIENLEKVLESITTAKDKLFGSGLQNRIEEEGALLDQNGDELTSFIVKAYGEF